MENNKKPLITDSGIEIKPLYNSSSETPADPGCFPYTRGVRSDMYLGKPWTMRQYAGFSTAEESNKRYRFLLEQGVTGLSVAFDLPTQIGYDSDHVMSEGEVGKVGVAIDTLNDMEALFSGIQLENVSTSMTINSTASILLCMYIALAKKQGANLTKLTGTVQNDILKEYAARGTYIYPPGPSMRIITDMFEYCTKEVPKWNTISISGYHIREAGSSAVQELAFTLANGKEYVKAAINKGLDVDVFGQRLSFFFNSHNNFFEEVAKFRAARTMWAQIMKDLGAKEPKAQMLRFHTQTGGSTLTAQQSENNVVRVTMQALAAVLGGTQSLHTNGFDEALALPTEKSAELALRTQQIIAFESGVTQTVDPLGGSYFIEELTNEMELKANKYLAQIEKMGGAVSAIEKGFYQKEISDAAYTYQKQIESNEKIIIGVNRFTKPETFNSDGLIKINENIRQGQIEKILKNKLLRNNEIVQSSLTSLKHSAKEGTNLMPFILDCVENYATLGEISDALREIFGEYQQN